jgi:hypothetical protein
MKMFLFVTISRFVIFVFGLLFLNIYLESVVSEWDGIEWQEGDDGCFAMYIMTRKKFDLLIPFGSLWAFTFF